jgi:Family of unknown function (DUF6069)
MTSISTATRHNDPQPRARASRRVLIGGLVGGVAATIAVEGYAAVARAAGVPMLAGAPGAHTASPITPDSFAVGVLVCTFWGTVLALLIAKLARRPARRFTRTAVLLTALSLISPLMAAQTAASTRLFLVGAHLIAASIVIPTVAKQLAHATPDRVEQRSPTHAGSAE